MEPENNFLDLIPVQKWDDLVRISNAIIANNGGVSLAAQDFKSTNYRSGATGWIIKANGDVEFNDGTFRGALSASTIDIGGSDSTSFHVDINGNMWLGDATFASAPFKVSNAGAITSTSGTIAGFSISSTTLINDTFKYGIASADGTYNIAMWFGETYANRFKAPFRIQNITGSEYIPVIEGASGANRYIEGRTTVAGVSTTRWQVLVGDSTAESGSDVGSDFKIIAYNDSGVLNLSFFPLVITRSTGLVTIGGELAINKAIKMDGTPNTDHTSCGPATDTFNAGATITVMDLVYLGSSSKWLQTDANASATAGDILLAISLESKTDTQAMKVALPGSFVRDDTWNWTPGAVLYISETASAITTTAPTTSGAIIRKVGYAVTADVIWFKPSDEYSIAP